MNMSHINEIIRDHHFELVGEYYIDDSGLMSRRNASGRSLTADCMLCYVIVVDGTVAYIGSTNQGLKRPLGYHKNEVMKRVNKGIKDALDRKQNVLVYTRTFDNDYDIDGLKVNIYQGYEIALIKKYDPAWNRQK